MFELPPIPAWDGLHPLIVHFPIALLLVAPLFIVLGLLVGRHSRLLMTSALVLMALGTAASYVAVSTPERRPASSLTAPPRSTKCSSTTSSWPNAPG